MPYVGRDLQRGNYLKLDDISSSFDGSTTTFNLTSGGNAFFPGSAFSIIVSLGGVIQEPESAFQIDRSQIIFATAPSPNDDFFCIVQGVALGVGVPGHNTVGNDQLAKPLSYGDYFRWDSANNRVGINTLLPSTALDVVGSATFSGNVSIGGTLTYEDVANIDAVGIITARAGIEDKTLTEGHVVFTGTNGRLTGESQLFYDTSSNKLGIGSDNPQELLSLMANGPCGISLLDSGHGQAATTIKIGNTGKDLSIVVPEDIQSTLTNGNYKINTNGSERLRIRGSDGHIGINTSIPTKLVTIKADKPFVRLEAEDGSDKRLDFEVTNTGIATISALQSSQQLSLKSVGGEVRLDASGNFLIGTTTQSGKLTVDSGTSNTVATFQSSDEGAAINLKDNHARSSIEQNDTTLKIIADTDGSDDDSQIRFQVDASTKMRINHDGEVQIGTTSDPTADIKLLVAGNGGVSSGSYFSFRGDYGNVPEPAAYAIKFDSSITRLHQYAYGGIAFNLGGQTRVNFTQAGRIGIGTTNPTAPIQINDGSPKIILRDTDNDSDIYIHNVGGAAVYSSIGDAVFQTPSTEIIRFAATGKVGIGTYTPLHELDISADGVAFPSAAGSTLLRLRDSSGTATLSIDAASNSSSAIQFGDTVAASVGSIIYNHVTDHLQFNTGGSGEKLRINSEGDIIAKGEIQTAQNYPNFRPVLDVNFTSIKKLDSRITYQRTGSASFTDELGIIRKVSENSPRFDHDPMSRECKGLLIEEARRNQWLYSEDLFTYVTGGNLQASTLANTTATTDPTGGSNAVLMAATASGGAHSFYKNFTSGSNGDVHTFSIWVKAAGVDYARIYVDTVGGNMNGPGVTFSTKNVWNVSATGVATQVESSAVEYPNGWWRLSVSGSFSNRNDYYCHVDLEGGEADIGFTGNGSDGMYVWGAQFEAGRFVTSYIPTYGYARDRGADIVRIMDDDFIDIFGTQFENFSVVADFDNSDSLDGNNASILEWWSDNNNYHDRIQIMKDNSSPYHIETRAFGGNSAIFNNGNLEASSEVASNRLATSWSADYSTSNAANRRWAFSFSGEAVDVVGDNTGTTVPALTRFGIGCSPYKLDLTRGILLFKRLMVYNQTLSDSQLRTLSAR